MLRDTVLTPLASRAEGEGVAPVALEAKPVEAEIHPPAAVDPASADEPERLRNAHSTV